MYDFIGDIHGHADKLEALLEKMGYSKKAGVYQHPTRKAFFVGDYIDRGPKIRETLQIVKAMRDTNNARALMGNHEYNALCFHYPESSGGHLRKHKIKNIIQHYETLKQFQNRQSEYEEYINWFKSLPVFFETNEFRAVHACWDQDNIDYIKSQPLYDAKLTDEYIYESVSEGSRFNIAIEETLKGKEISMPPGLSFTDKDGELRKEIRIKWWEDPSKTSYKDISIEPLDSLPDTSVDTSFLKNTNFYAEDKKPVFFGHYWLKGNPSINRNNICCLDYSVAKEGKLVAYRFDGEQVLSNEKLVYV
ncbi:MAG: phosphoesterase [Chitinophagaceae bacterium BSSC1]|nr:MAG: phosphoesterase [Chitinophagaceae bacterium BSSC1]